MKKKNKSSKFLSGALVGAALGVAASIFASSKTGKEMEKELKDKINGVLPKPLIEHIDFKKSRRVYRLKTSEDLMNQDEDSQESITPKEAELINDAELREHFKKAYKHRQKIKLPKA
jgi:gas vesicle protein